MAIYGIELKAEALCGEFMPHDVLIVDTDITACIGDIIITTDNNVKVMDKNDKVKGVNRVIRRVRTV